MLSRSQIHFETASLKCTAVCDLKLVTFHPNVLTSTHFYHLTYKLPHQCPRGSHHNIFSYCSCSDGCPYQTPGNTFNPSLWQLNHLLEAKPLIKCLLVPKYIVFESISKRTGKLFHYILLLFFTKSQLKKQTNKKNGLEMFIGSSDLTL